MKNENVKYKFFWGGIFSNWYPSEFVIDDIKYSSGENFMMYQKAMLFNDTEIAALILAEPNPRNQKALGRKVKNFIPEKWSEVCYDLVKDGLRQKFLQNRELLTYLKQYKDYVIVEASPEDRIWGIGYDSENALANINNWGTNLLGKMLTELSNEL